MLDVIIVSAVPSLLPSSLLHCLPTDPEGGREDIHDLLCVGDLCGLVLLGESDLSCGGHGLRGAEPGHHGRGPAEGGGIQGHAGSAQETAGRRSGQPRQDGARNDS